MTLSLLQYPWLKFLFYRPVYFIIPSVAVSLYDGPFYFSLYYIWVNLYSKDWGQELQSGFNSVYIVITTVLVLFSNSFLIIHSISLHFWLFPPIRLTELLLLINLVLISVFRTNYFYTNETFILGSMVSTLTWHFLFSRVTSTVSLDAFPFSLSNQFSALAVLFVVNPVLSFCSFLPIFFSHHKEALLVFGADALCSLS